MTSLSIAWIKKLRKKDEKQKSLKDLRPRLTLFRLDPLKRQGENIFASTQNLKNLFTDVFSISRKINGATTNKCPHCNAPMYATKPFIDDGVNTLKCPHCNFEEEVLFNRAELVEKSQTSKSTAKILILIAVAIASICAVYAVFSGNKLTLVGGIFIALSFFIQSLLFRYKAWQYQTGRLYEKKPPLKDWLLSIFKK